MIIMPRKIESIQHFLQLMRGAKKAGASFNTISLLPADVANLVKRSALHHEVHDDNLLVYIDHGTHWETQVLVSSLSTLKNLPERTLTFNYVQRLDSFEHERIISQLAAHGFSLLATNLEMALPSSDLQTLQTDDCAVVNATHDDISSIISLWQQTLDPLSNPWPAQEELEANLATYYVLKSTFVYAAYCLRNMAGYLRAERIAVAPTQQGKGIGSRLMASIDHRRRGQQVKLWVEQQNGRAINLYKKHGYIVTGRKSRQFLRKGSTL